MIFILFLSCKPSLINSINQEYKYEYLEDDFTKIYADCIRESRKALLDILLSSNIVKNQRVYIVEIYNPQLNSLEAKIITTRFNYTYKRDNYDSCGNVKRWYPGENYPHDYFDFLVSMAKENKFSELTELYKKYPISNSGLVYLTVVDFSENKRNYKLIKTISFPEFRIF